MEGGESGARPEPGMVQVINKDDIETMSMEEHDRRDLEGIRQARRKQKRKIGRRRLGVVGAVITTIGTLTAAITGGLLNKDSHAIDESARNEISQRTATTETVKQIEEEALNRFLPGTTTVDLTRARFRNSPEVINGDDVTSPNTVDVFNFKTLEGTPITKEFKTMSIENAELVDAKDRANGHFITIELINEKGGKVTIYTSYDGLGVKEQGIVVSEADSTHKSGFVERSGDNSRAFMPDGTKNGTPVDLSSLNQVSFSPETMSSNH